MHREILIACAPYVAAIFACSGLLYLLVRLSGARLQLAHVGNLNRDQQGGVQSLSFVLTLPVFVMILMFIVQLSQITIATVVVEYAAFAAARAAMVWIPAETSSEYANQIGVYRQTGTSSGGTNTSGYAVYQVDPTGFKFQKIHFAAAMACLPICPSRDTGASANHPSMQSQSSLTKAYQAISPATSNNPKIPTRLANKLAYALNNTHVFIEVHHPTRVDLGSDAPLARHPELDRYSYPVEFTDNEYGWQDQLYVTVSHDFALLPGPGRLLARQDSARPGTGPETAPGSDRIAQSLTKRGDAYARTISATVRLNNEGQKSSLPYYQTIFGQQVPNMNASDYAASGEKSEEDSENGEPQTENNDEECCGEGVGVEEAGMNEEGQREGEDGEGNQEGENREGNNQEGENQEGKNETGEPREGEKPPGDKPPGDQPREGDKPTGETGGDKLKETPPAGDKPKETPPTGDEPKEEPKPTGEQGEAGQEGGDRPKEGPAPPVEQPKEGGDKPAPPPPQENKAPPGEGSTPPPGEQPVPKPDGVTEKPVGESQGEVANAK